MHVVFPECKSWQPQAGDGMDLDSVGLEYGVYNNDHHLTQRFYKGTM
jgi:hypothetical protein